MPGLAVGSPLAIAFAEIEARARDLVQRGTAENTKRAYRSDLRYVTAWMRHSGLGSGLPLSVEDAIRFVVDHFHGMSEEVDEALVRDGVKADLGPLSPSTVSRRFAAISAAHDSGGLENPCRDTRVVKLFRKARAAHRIEGWAPVKKVAAPKEILDALLATCEDDGELGVRDRALLLFGWSTGGRRRSEIVGATYERLVPMGSEYVYELGVTKTSQDGDTGTVPVAGRAAVAMRDWLGLSAIVSGPLFRAMGPKGWGRVALSDRAVCRIVQSRARKAGFEASRFGGHSLRSGFMTEAGFRNVPLSEAMAMSMHKSVQVAMGYHQAGHGLRNQAARLLD